MSTSNNSLDVERERTKRAKIVVAGVLVIAFFALWGLVFKPVWPMALGVTALAVMSSVIFWVVLRK